MPAIPARTVSILLLPMSLALLMSVLVACGESAKESRIARGKYLVETMGCGDCHSSHGPDHKPVPGMEFAGHLASQPLPTWTPAMMEGHAAATMHPSMTAFAGPFGVSVAPNLTPCPETGIGELTAAALIESWRTGKHWKFDRPVLPPMPVPFYRNLTDEDVTAIHAYLMSRPPVHNRAPDSIVAPAK